MPTHEAIRIRATGLSVLADGSSLDTIYADLPEDAMTSALGVKFQAASGFFANGFDTMSVFASRTDLASGKITAVAIFRASLRSGSDTLSASTTTIPVYTDYLMITQKASNVDSIGLTPSSYTLKDTFAMQVTITATLANSKGGPVSMGNTITFTDLTDMGTPAGGSFKPPVISTDSAKVTTIYFPPVLTIAQTTGNYITIKAAATGVDGSPSGRPGSARIFISP